MVKLFYPRNRTKDEQSNSKAYISTIIAAFFWGTSFIVVEFGLELINPFWFAQLRFITAGLGSIAIVYILGKRIDKKMFFSRWVWLMGMFNALGFLGQFVGQTMTNATKTALLINLNLVTIAILSIFIFNERFTKQKYFAVSFAIIGVILLTTNGNFYKLTTGEFIGDMFAFAAGLSWAFYIVTNKKIVNKPGTDVVTLTACVMVTTAIWLVPVTLTFGGINSSIFNIGYYGFGYIIYLGLICNVFTFILWSFGLKYLSATASTILLLIEVLTAAVLAMLLLDEFLTTVGIFGGICIVVAAILINLNLKSWKLTINKKK
jgi:drug/metabolite transporter (DMT)-like permease